ncbi:UV radiation resistance protein/autophagy-related protein 14 [Sesbania bispinosa]|nr:UV radiation resistance protein/autophagy-related protein 14 [Sesbania bispinosa]
MRYDDVLGIVLRLDSSGMGKTTVEFATAPIAVLIQFLILQCHLIIDMGTFNNSTLVGPQVHYAYQVFDES